MVLRKMNQSSIIAICFVFIGCCSNVVFLELLINEAPGAGNIITFCQFLLISLQGFIFTSKWGTIAPKIPIKQYVFMVTMFFVVQVTNNLVFAFNISMPLHMIYRSGSLIANLILGVFILKKRYTISKYASVIMISVGITMATLASTGDASTSVNNGNSDTSAADYIKWLTGLGILTFALFTSAGMGIFQETVYQKYGKHPSEALFYNHVLPLPGFLLLSNDIYRHVLLFNASDPILIPYLSVLIPKMWLYLIGNILTQFICIKSVFILTTECSSLTVTFVLTLRKFLSLVFSIFYFQNPFTIHHWIGTGLVFGGIALFTDVFQRLYSFRRTSKKID